VQLKKAVLLFTVERHGRFAAQPERLCQAAWTGRAIGR
jgi:hypothetical protein